VRLKRTAGQFSTELRGEAYIIYTYIDDDRYDDYLSWTNTMNKVPR
jgi:hypothetical protein